MVGLRLLGSHLLPIADRLKAEEIRADGARTRLPFRTELNRRGGVVHVVAGDAAAEGWITSPGAP